MTILLLDHHEIKVESQTSIHPVREISKSKRYGDGMGCESVNSCISRFSTLVLVLVHQRSSCSISHQRRCKELVVIQTVNISSSVSSSGAITRSVGPFIFTPISTKLELHLSASLHTARTPSSPGDITAWPGVANFYFLGTTDAEATSDWTTSALSVSNPCSLVTGSTAKSPE